MKRIFTILLTVLISTTCSQYMEWVKSHNGSGNSGDEALFVMADNQGNCIVAGNTISSGLNRDITVIKYDPMGTVLWSSVYNGAGNELDQAAGLEIDNSGNVYVTGITENPGSNIDIVTIKLNSAGVQQWAQVWAGPAGFSDEAAGIYVDAIGNVYVCGHTEIVSGNLNYITLKYNSGGMLQWSRMYNGPLNNTDAALLIDGESNNIYVTGTSDAPVTGTDFLTIKYNSSGDSLWIARYSGSNSINEIPSGFKVDENGNVYVTGRTQGTTSGTDYMTVKYNTNRVEQWQSRYTSPGNSQDIPEGLTIDNAGNVYVTGRTRINSSYNDFGTVKYNSAGVEQWVAIYDNSPESRDDYGCDIAVDANGNVYVTGNSQQSGTDRDVLTIKYNSSGIEQRIHPNKKNAPCEVACTPLSV